MADDLSGFDGDATIALWQETLFSERRRFLVLREWTAGLVTGALVALGVFAVHPSPWSGVLASLLAVPAGLMLARLVWASTGERRRHRDAVNRYLAASRALDEVLALGDAMGDALVALGARGETTPGHEPLHLVKLRKQLEDNGRIFDDRLYAALAEVALERLALRSAEIARRRSYTDQQPERRDPFLDKIRDLEMRLAVATAPSRDSPRQVHIDPLAYPEPVVLHYPQDGQIPFSAVATSPALMRSVVEGAQQAAEEGRVNESYSAGVILSEPTRWAAHAAPFKLTRELMELFEPSQRDALEPLLEEQRLRKG